MAELPRGVQGHTYTGMITIFFGAKLGILGGNLLPFKYPRQNPAQGRSHSVHVQIGVAKTDTCRFCKLLIPS